MQIAQILSIRKSTALISALNCDPNTLGEKSVHPMVIGNFNYMKIPKISFTILWL